MTPGERFGPYELIVPIGKGGMGEVWKARDTRLDRIVALKVSKKEFSARFEREARAIAALNHPHVCTLHDVGPNYLVMEYVEGAELKGPLPLSRTIELASQILDALDAAHRKGITHRDLKPANIMVTKAGVKVLDFGLAKLERPGTLPADAPTALTAHNEIAGTLFYMAPEQMQAREDVDSRADIFAFGCVLYEMLTGKRAFQGSNAASVIAAVMERPAPSVAEVAPAALDRVLKKCLEKDREERWQSARDVKAQLEWTAAAPQETVAVTRRNVAPWATAAIFAAITVALGWIAWRATRPVDHPLTRLSVDLGPEAMVGLNLTVAISPDGRRLVFPVRGPNGKQQLAMRLLDQAQATPLPGTEGAGGPFFSPDGQWIGFSTNNFQLKKISVQGGAPVTLANAGGANNVWGAAWTADGNLVTALGLNSPLSRIPASGGTPQGLTKLAPGEITHRWPQFLPVGNAVLFTASPAVTAWDSANIEAISLKTGKVKILVRGGYYGRYMPSGHLVYVHQGVLFGVRFDPERLEVRGAPVPVLEDVAANPINGGGQFDFSNTGTLVYVAGKSTAQAWQVAWLDISGKMQPLITAPGAYSLPRISPDGRKLAFLGDDADLYVHDLDRDTTTRLTFTGHANVSVWAPDGRHLTYQSVGLGLYWVRSDGVGDPQRLLDSPYNPTPWSFSADGRRLAYFERNPDTGNDIWTLPLDLTDPEHPRAGKPEPFLRTPAEELLPRFSPDGRWLAYRSNESGSNEIYVQPFPGGSGGKWQISTGGGLYVLWSNDGRELFYETADNRIMVVDYRVDGASFVPGKPRLWSDKQLFYAGNSNLDLAPDGKRFAVLTLPEAAGGATGSVHVTFLLNFFDELKRKIP